MLVSFLTLTSILEDYLIFMLFIKLFAILRDVLKKYNICKSKAAHLKSAPLYPILN